ncbi:MAG TPA: hypothetical protein ENK40_04470 [Gammaproteobacteria bacterium]|nr:hypothetical protein [Gammaproteobacteria bacterium]
MKKTSLMLLLALATSPVLADETGNMHMKGMQGGGMKACENMHAMRQENMKGMMEMKKQHMRKMETHLANIEKLLRELVEMKRKDD